MTKYSFEDKRQVIDHHLRTGSGAKSLGKRFGISPSQILHWINLHHYHGWDGLTRRSRSYTVAFKLSVISRMHAESWSAKTASAFFGIPSPSTVETWAKRYAASGEAGLIRRPKRMQRKRPKKKVNLEELLDKPIAEMTAEELREELLYRRAETDYLKKLDALVQKRRSDERSDH